MDQCNNNDDYLQDAMSEQLIPTQPILIEGHNASITGEFYKKFDDIDDLV